MFTVTQTAQNYDPHWKMKGGVDWLKAERESRKTGVEKSKTDQQQIKG